MNKTKKMTTTALLVSVGVITSHLVYIPTGFAKVFPIQHFLNVLSVALLGPYYAVVQALLTSTIRNLLGTGSLLAFPGSIIGAFLAGVLYMKTKKLVGAVIGEVMGTGIIGAMACYPVVRLFLGQDAALFGFIPSFLVSSIVGSILGWFLLKAFIKTNYLGGVLYENSSNDRRF
ncbi:energy coupling factor transporter S component ThiW [Bacillus seohaeanensis]|uniref:Energy coupling factor transporter S component ThiW n=1 Tax=Bacillus seohaeanensis TaxID=284580 RepID=A0ABW5RQP2_9BACI